jgi:enoyl-CoA hydratase
LVLELTKRRELMALKNLMFTKEDRVGIITVNRPEKRNALDLFTRQEIRQVLNEVERDQDIRVLIITGAGDKAFISGADIKDFVNFTPLNMYEYVSTLGQQL